MNNNINKLVIIVIVILFVIGGGYAILVGNVFKVFLSEGKDKLICSANTQDGYAIEYRTKFSNNSVSEVIVKFVNRDSSKSEGYSSTKNQIDFFCNLPGTTMKYINSDLFITINKEAYKSNKKEDIINIMFSDYDSIKAYYKKLGYTCK